MAYFLVNGIASLEVRSRINDTVQHSIWIGTCLCLSILEMYRLSDVHAAGTHGDSDLANVKMLSAQSLNNDKEGPRRKRSGYYWSPREALPIYHNETVTHNISANSNAKSTSAIFTLSRHHKRSQHPAFSIAECHQDRNGRLRFRHEQSR